MRRGSRAYSANGNKQMSITVTIPDELAIAVQELSNRSGELTEQVLIAALRAYFPPVSRELQAEFDALERASDSDFIDFERSTT